MSAIRKNVEVKELTVVRPAISVMRSTYLEDASEDPNAISTFVDVLTGKLPPTKLIHREETATLLKKQKPQKAVN